MRTPLSFERDVDRGTLEERGKEMYAYFSAVMVMAFFAVGSSLLRKGESVSAIPKSYCMHFQINYLLCHDRMLEYRDFWSFVLRAKDMLSLLRNSLASFDLTSGLKSLMYIRKTSQEISYL
jgi:hypothetical protein